MTSNKPRPDQVDKTTQALRQQITFLQFSLNARGVCVCVCVQS